MTMSVPTTDTISEETVKGDLAYPDTVRYMRVNWPSQNHGIEYAVFEMICLREN